MFQEYYGLTRDPFALSPDLEFLFLSNTHEEAIAHLVYGLEQNEEFICLIGDIGTGKTLALHRLLEQVSPTLVPVSVNVTTIGFAELLQLILLNLTGEAAQGQPVAQMIFQLEQQLKNLGKQGKRVLLIIDEAQNLSVKELESVRLLMNLGEPGEHNLQIVLSGQLGLQAMLEQSELRQLRQRIKVSYTLGPLSRGEMEAYLVYRLEKAGRTDPLFRKDALDNLFQSSGGIPRVVNYLASKALLNGYVDESAKITTKHVDEAVAESENLLAEIEEAPAIETSAPAKPAAKVEPAPAARPERETRPKAEPAPARRRASRSAPAREKKPRRRAGLVVFLVLLVAVAAAYLTYPRWKPLLAGESAEPTTATAQRTDPAAGQKPLEIAGSQQDQADPEQPVAQDGTQTVATQDAQDVQDETTDAEPADGPAGEAAQEPAERPAEPQQEAAEPAAAQATPAAAATTPPAAAAVDSFIVHVASFQDQARASNFRRRLEARGLQAFVRESPASSRRTWYRVYIGPFAGHDRAAEVVAELKADGTINYSQIAKR